MAMTETYLNTDLATGANDGTSEADAWQTWAAATITAGSRLNVKNPASRATESITKSIATSSSSNTPWAIRGYGSTIGDGVLARFSEVLLNISGKHCLVESLDLESSQTGTCVAMNGINSAIYNCKIKVTNSIWGRAIHGVGGCHVANCVIEVDGGGTMTSGTSGAIDISNGVAYCNIVKILSWAGPGASFSGIRLHSPIEHTSGAVRNLIYVPRGNESGHLVLAGIRCADQSSSGDYGGFHIVNNTIDNMSVGIHIADSGSGNISGTSCIANNLITGCPYAFHGQADNYISIPMNVLVRNATDGNTSGCAVYEPVRITQSPYTDVDNQDFSLNSVAGGGASCRANAMDRNGTLDIGAIGA